MGVRGLFKDIGGRATTAIKDVGAQVRSYSFSRGSMSQEIIPEDVQESMRQQNMATGPFTPGAPIAPYRPLGEAPVITPFLVGQNIFAVPRGTVGVGFDTLKNIISNWDLARLCIEVRQDELRSLDWEILFDDEGENAKLYESEIKAARKFFEHPSGYYDFSSFLFTASEDWLRYDGLAIYKHRTRGGKLGALEIIDTTTITPLIDGRGATPRYPAPAYLQWAWGLPWVWLTEEDLIYVPHRPRPETRYGLPPAEWVLLTANTDLRLQWWFLSYFTEGEMPEAFVNAPPDIQDPKQVKALQDAYSAVMSGAKGVHHKVKWIPAGANVHLAGKEKFDVDFAAHLIAKGCAAFKVQPAEIGFTEKVNKSSGETQENVQYRRSIKPTARYFESIINRVLHNDLNMPYARFKFHGIEENEDRLQLAKEREVYIQNGVLSADDVRQTLGYDTDPDAPVGRTFVTRTGIVFIDAESQKRARELGSLAAQNGLILPDGLEDNDEETVENTGASFLTPTQVITDPAFNIKSKSAGAPPESTKATLHADLRKWEKQSLKRIKVGKKPRFFDSDAIDDLAKALIWDSLKGASTQTEVKKVFAPALGGNIGFEKAAKSGKGKKVKVDAAKLEASEKKIAGSFAKFFAKQGPKIAKHVVEGLKSENLIKEAIPEPQMEPDVDHILRSYGWQGWEKVLKADIAPEIVAIFNQAAEEGITALAKSGETIEFSVINPKAVEYADNRAAELVGKKILPGGAIIDNPNSEFAITESTRNMVKEQVVSAIKEGKTPHELEKDLQDNYAFSETRAQSIARTELGVAYNRGAVAGYRVVKIQHVEVFDGDSDGACAEADGSIWTLDEAEANPKEHPNCVRSFSPIPPDEDPDYEQDSDSEGEADIEE